VGSRNNEPFGNDPYPPGSFERSYSYMYPNKQVPGARQSTHIVGPSMSFRTDIPLDEAFLRMLKVLSRSDFNEVVRYKGPWMGFRASRDEPLDVGEVIAAFHRYTLDRIPLSGFSATLLHASEEGVSVKVKVGGFGRTKVRLKVRGTVRFSEWKKLHTRVDKRLDADL